IKSVIVKQTSTVAVSRPVKAMPVPGVERIEGFTTTMYAIVKNVVMPAIASVRRFGFWSSTDVIVIQRQTLRSVAECSSYRNAVNRKRKRSRVQDYQRANLIALFLLSLFVQSQVQG